MTEEELQTLLAVLQIEEHLATAARAVIIQGNTTQHAAQAHEIDAAQLDQALAQIKDAELRIRGSFVRHAPDCWEVVVGHHDHHRAPGGVTLAVGDEVRLICARVGVMVPVRITRLPDEPHGYCRGVVLKVERSSMRYRRGDGVVFSDDQAVLPAGIRRPRRPIPI